jgi:hypothetical protein
MRWLTTLFVITAAAPALAQMGGAEFKRLCERDAAPCAGIIRAQLKGWPKQVLDPAALKQGRFEQVTCPPHQPDPVLAAAFVDQAKKLKLRVDGLSVHEAIEAVFTQAFPACASSRDS